MTKKVYFHTFGCRANQYDTALVRQAFVDQGALIVDDPAAADLAVVNSCTVTHESEVMLRSFVRRLARGSAVETVVIGCAAARDDGTIAALPRVRAVVGGAEPRAVLGAAGLDVSSPFSRRERGTGGEDQLRERGTGGEGQRRESGTGGEDQRARGLLKIQDGCDEHCTFCATTLARGANRSRSIPQLVQEARALAARHAEIVLTGVHIGTYGRDSGLGVRASGVLSRVPNPEPRAPSLGTLLESLITALPAVRFRLSSIEATEVDDTIGRLLIEAPRHLAAHLHAPLQSGSNRVLKRMARHWYTAESYRARLEWLAARMPVLGLGADIIAGFPGETDADHQATLALVAALPFTYLHVFPYSARPGAAATRLGAPVPTHVLRQRARELRELGERKAAAYRAARQGGRGDGVVCGRSHGRVEVLTQDYLSVYVPTDQWDGEKSRFEVTIR